MSITDPITEKRTALRYVILFLNAIMIKSILFSVCFNFNRMLLIQFFFNRNVFILTVFLLIINNSYIYFNNFIFEFYQLLVDSSKYSAFTTLQDNCPAFRSHTLQIISPSLPNYVLHDTHQRHCNTQSDLQI